MSKKHDAVDLPENRNIVGPRIAEYRKKIGMKQTELRFMLLSYGIDIGKSALSKIETGTKSVTDYELKALAEVLGLSADYLLDLYIP